MKTLFTLTSAQRLVWYDQKLKPHSARYNVGGYVSIEGSVNHSFFQDAVNELVKESDALRTGLEVEDGIPYQYFLPYEKSTLELIDFSHKSSPLTEAHIWMEAATLKPLSMNGKNLFINTLIKITEDKYYWFFIFHHIIVDSWAISLLVKRLGVLYSAMVKRESLPQTTFNIYQRFIEEDQKYLSSQVFKEDESFWVNKFSSLPEPIPFKKNFSVESHKKYPSTRRSFMVERLPYNEIKSFLEKDNLSGFHLFLGLIYTYFSRVYQQNDIVIGVPILNRSGVVNKNTVGLYTSIMALRLNYTPEITFGELIKNIKNELRQCFRYQKYPINELYKQLKLHALGKDGLFDIVLSYKEQNFTASFDNLDSTTLPVYNRHDYNALVVQVEDYYEDRDIKVDLDYSNQIWDDASAHLLEGHLKNLLIETQFNFNKSLNEIKIITDKEKIQLLTEFNNTEKPYTRNKTVIQIIEEQIEKSPNNIAVVSNDQQISYAELNLRANRLACFLRDKGVMPDQIVSIMAEPSWEMIVGILAILKSGAAYLPIDPKYPAKRIQQVLKDSNSKFLLTHNNLANSVSTCTEIADISYFEEGDAVKNLPNVNTASDLVYVVYTSGSTGAPKGVMVEHVSLVNLCYWHIEQFNVTGNDKAAKYAGFSFDASVWEIFPYLFTGATLYMINDELKLDIYRLNDFFEQNYISIAFLPTQIAEQFIKLENKSLRVLLSGGDRLKSYSKQSYKFYNNYGPSENTVVSSCYLLNENNIADFPPIGKPIANTKIYILDKYNQLLPVGSPGELCISGAGLARGYLNHEKLTAEKFISNPFIKGERIYKTGDLACWNLDGNIEFLGRIDEQVKIRGNRIEPAEIEAVLLQYPGVESAIISIHEHQKTGKSLCAYLVSDKEFKESDLRVFLEDQLPDYMVPAFFIKINEVPLTANGKVDKAELPIPLIENAGSSSEKPRNEIEEILVRSWCSFLGIDKISIKDNFFSLGGDSIKAIQIASRLYQQGLKVEPRLFFEFPSIAQLSHFVKKTEKKQNNRIAEGKVELSPIQQWFFQQKFQNQDHWNQAIMLFSPEGFNEVILKETLRILMLHHDSLRTVFNSYEGKISQYNKATEGAVVELSVFDLRNAAEIHSEVAALANKIQSSIDLENGPLFKSGIFKTSDGDHLLLIGHHLVVDGVSWRIILEDFAFTYRNLLNREEIKLPEKTSFYGDWVQAITKYSTTNKLLEEIPFWKKIESMNRSLFPGGEQFSDTCNIQNRKLQFLLNQEETNFLLKEVNKTYNTEINDILLAALSWAVSDWKGNEDVLISLEGHGRDSINQEIDLTRTVGWFTSVFPLLINTKHKYHVSDLIKNVKEQLRLLPNKGLGYNILKYITPSHLKEELHFDVKPEICFNYLGQMDQIENSQIFSFSDLPVGNMLSEKSSALFPLEINAIVKNRKLQVDISCSKEKFTDNTMELFRDSFKEKLLTIISHCLEKTEVEYTPSDFDSDLSFDELDKILGKISEL